MNYSIALLQIILLIVVWYVEKLLAKVFRGRQKHQRKHNPIGWTVILWILIIYNIASPYWIAYPIACWMVVAILLVIGQTVHYHEFIYRRFWPVFWQVSLFLSIIFFGISLFCQHLPQV